MRALGLDPGISTTGYAVVERTGSRLRAVAVGAIRTPAELPQAERLRLLHSAVSDVIEAAAPGSMAIERVFFNANVRTAMSVGQAAGVAMLAAAMLGVEVVDYTPTEVKASVTGHGSAPKKQVGAMVATMLGLPAAPTPADAADACALAICHLNRSGLTRAIAAKMVTT